MGGDGLKVMDLGIRTIDKINFELPPGSSVGVSGPSGSGKTLFLRALADIDPHQGRMWLDGIPSESMPVHRWRRLVGLLPAESAWWHDTVGLHFTDGDVSWLADLGFSQQVLDWDISRLSSGERQRLALLRLLTRNPRVLLLDEPTANLDADNSRRVEKVLAAYCKIHQPVVLWVSHDSGQLHRNCSSIYTLQERRLILTDRVPPPTLEER